MDYEYYSVDPYDPSDIDGRTQAEVLALFSPAYQEAERKIAAFFRPVMTVKHPRAIFPLEAFTFGDNLLTLCKTPADLEATLLR